MISVLSREILDEVSLEADTTNQMKVTLNRFLLKGVVRDVSIEAIASNQTGGIVQSLI